MSALGEIAKGIGEVGEGYYGAKQQAEEYRRKLEEQEEQKRQFYAQLAERARADAMAAQRNSEPQYTGTDETGPVLYDPVRGVMTRPKIEGAPWKVTPKPTAEENYQSRLKLKLDLEKQIDSDPTLSKKEKDERKKMIGAYIAPPQPSFSLQTLTSPTGEPTPVFVNSKVPGDVRPAPAGLIPKGSEGAQVQFDSMPDGPRKWAFGRGKKLMEPIDKKMVEAAKEDDKHLLALGHIKDEFTRLLAGVPPESRNDPLDLILNKFKRGVYRMGLSPGELDRLISMTSREKYSAVKAIAPGIRRGDLIEKIVEHMPDATQEPATFIARLDSVERDIRDDLQESLQYSNLMPDEWAAMKGRAFAAPGPPSGGAAKKYGSILDLKKAVAAGEITPADARKYAVANGMAQ